MVKKINYNEYQNLLHRAIKAHSEKTGLDYPRAVIDLAKKDPKWFTLQRDIGKATDYGKKEIGR